MIFCESSLLKASFLQCHIKLYTNLINVLFSSLKEYPPFNSLLLLIKAIKLSMPEQYFTRGEIRKSRTLS